MIIGAPALRCLRQLPFHRDFVVAVDQVQLIVPATRAPGRHDAHGLVPEHRAAEVDGQLEGLGRAVAVAQRRHQVADAHDAAGNGRAEAEFLRDVRVEVDAVVALGGIARDQVGLEAEFGHGFEGG